MYGIHLKTMALPDDTTPQPLPTAPPAMSDHLLESGVVSKFSVKGAGGEGVPPLTVSQASPL